MGHPGFQINRFADTRTLASAAARLWVDDLAATAAPARYCVALSGGRIAREFLMAVARHLQRRRLDLEPLHFFWADERCVSPTDPESNYRLARETLFAPLSLDPNGIHRIRGEANPDEAAAESEAELRRIAPAAANGQPVLDLAILGMGEDGHIASLFPKSLEPAADSDRVYRAVLGPKPPPRRVTLGYATLAAARKAWVLVSGPGKEAALAESLQGNASTPLGQLLARRPLTSIFTDIAGA